MNGRAAGILPGDIWKNLTRRVVPLGLARALSQGTPILLQFALLAWFGPEEAGIYWILASVVILSTVVSDAGAANAFPVLFGPGPGQEHPRMVAILRARLALAGIAGGSLALLGGIGKAVAALPMERACLFFLVVGRVLLMSHQGFTFARERFAKLLAAAVAEFLVAVAGFAAFNLFAAHGMGIPGRPATFALLSLCLATWTALLLLDVPSSVWGFDVAGRETPAETSARTLAENGQPAVAFLGPFALCSLWGAIFTRGDAVVAGFLLDPASAGILGTLEALYRLLIFPVYASGQGMFPALRAAWLRLDAEELARLSRLHRATGWRLVFLGGLLAVGCWIIGERWAGFGPGAGWRMAALWYLIAIPVAVPNAFVMPEYFSRDRQWMVARLAMPLAIGRPLLALILASKAGLAGMALNHLFFDLAQATLFGVVIPWKEGRFQASRNS